MSHRGLARHVSRFILQAGTPGLQLLRARARGLQLAARVGMFPMAALDNRLQLLALGFGFDLRAADGRQAAVGTLHLFLRER
jgi:hypothetical protein